MIMPLGESTQRKGKLTSKERAESLGMSRRTYDLNRSIINIIEEVRDNRETPYFPKMDMVKLSQQTPAVQREICDLLITGKTNAFKRALQRALLADWKDRKPKETVEFNIKERWDTEEHNEVSKADNHLQELVQLINESEECSSIKRTATDTNSIPNAMIAEHSQFLETITPKRTTLSLITSVEEARTY